MKLYHFTAQHLLNDCLRDGLALGCIPLSVEPPKVIPGFQWLTKNGRFDQSWCRHSTLPYRRNDFRIVVRIPKCQKRNLIHWLLYCEMKKIASAKDLNAFGDPENWYLFRGIVRPEWFKKVSRNPL